MTAKPNKIDRMLIAALGEGGDAANARKLLLEKMAKDGIHVSHLRFTTTDDQPRSTASMNREASRMVLEAENKANEAERRAKKAEKDLADWKARAENHSIVEHMHLVNEIAAIREREETLHDLITGLQMRLAEDGHGITHWTPPTITLTRPTPKEKQKQEATRLTGVRLSKPVIDLLAALEGETLTAIQIMDHYPHSRNKLNYTITALLTANLIKRVGTSEPRQYTVNDDLDDVGKAFIAEAMKIAEEQGA